MSGYISGGSWGWVERSNQEDENFESRKRALENVMEAVYLRLADGLPHTIQVTETIEEGVDNTGPIKIHEVVAQEVA